jgi:hypothetical protein
MKNEKLYKMYVVIDTKYQSSEKYIPELFYYFQFI